MQPQPSLGRVNGFTLTRLLGKGTFGTVYQATRETDGRTYAIKKVDTRKMGAKDRAEAVNEIRILASIAGAHIISFFEAFVEQDILYIITEFATHGDLFGYLKDARKKGPIKEATVWSLFIQMALGLKSLHDRNILHRDLKGANIFMCSDTYIKLGARLAPAADRPPLAEGAAPQQRPAYSPARDEHRVHPARRRARAPTPADAPRAPSNRTPAAPPLPSGGSHLLGVARRRSGADTITSIHPLTHERVLLNPCGCTPQVTMGSQRSSQNANSKTWALPTQPARPQPTLSPPSATPPANPPAHPLKRQPSLRRLRGLEGAQVRAGVGADAGGLYLLYCGRFTLLDCTLLYSVKTRPIVSGIVYSLLRR